MSDNKILIGKYREFFPERQDYPLMTESFEKSIYPGQGKIIYFLLHGKPRLLGMSSCYDVFTGERICMTKMLMSYDIYEWWEELVHYVKNYNLRLPKDFETFILSVSIKEVYINYRKHQRD